MYEILLKWGMDNLGGFAKVKSNQDHSITLEAIKAKNILVAKRFDIMWDTHRELVDLAIEIEEHLVEFKELARETNNTLDEAKKFVGDLSRDLHPMFYRRFKKLRSRFDGVNDLLSAYSQEFSKFIHIDYLKEIYKAKEVYSRSGIVRIYRGLWTKLIEVIASLIRISSSDLRFWLTDNPSTIYARRWAKIDAESLHSFLATNEWYEGHFNLILESPNGLKDYWDNWEHYKREAMDPENEFLLEEL